MRRLIRGHRRSVTLAAIAALLATFVVVPHAVAAAPTTPARTTPARTTPARTTTAQSQTAPTATGGPSSHHVAGPRGATQQVSVTRRPGGYTGYAAQATQATTGSYTVSADVLAFLTTRGLRLPLSTSRTLTGTLANGVLTVTTGAPRALGLPTGVTMPAFTATTLSIVKATNTLTLTAHAGTASLTVTIPAANTSTLAAGGSSGRLALPATVLGKVVPLAGPITAVADAPRVSLTGSFGSADVVRTGVLALAAGVTVSAATGGHVQITGAATVGAAAHVTVSGPITSPTSWTLTATAPSSPTTWSPFAGVSFTPKFAGRVTDTAGDVTYRLATSVATTWQPSVAVTETVRAVTYANSAPPAGAPAVATDGAWVQLTGTLGVTAASHTPLHVPGTAIVSVATRADTITATSTSTPVTLPWTPAVTLSHVALSGSGTVGATASARLTGSGTITVGTESPASAAVTVTSAGVLVVDFTGQLADFGLGAAGRTGEVLYASAAAPAFALPSGTTVNLPQGFANAQGRKAVEPTPGSATYTISPTTLALLNQLGLKLASATITGTESGTVITVTTAAPKLPVTLPAGESAITFGPATLTIDTAADTLKLTATASATTGPSADLSVTIGHVSQTTLGGADLSTKADITGLALFGASLDLTGSLGWSAGKVSASLTATLTSPLVVAAGAVTIDAGTTVTVSTASGLTVSGSLDLGAAPSLFTVSFNGAISSLSNWSLQVSDDGSAPSFTPITGLTLTPNFTGSISDTDGTIGFDVAGHNVLSWQPTGDVSVAVTNVEISNQAPATGLNCPDDLHAGQIFADISGTASYTPATSSVNVSGSVEACVVPSARTFLITGAVTGSLVPSTAGFTLTGISLAVHGDLAAATFSVTASADLSIDGYGTTVGIKFGNDGAFVAGAVVPDLSKLGLAGTNGYLLFANKAVSGFDPASLGLHNTDGSAIPPFDLPAGVTVTMAFTLSGQTLQAIQKLHIPLDGATIQLMATLSSSGFSVKILVNFGAGNQGFQFIKMANGLELDLDTLSVGFDVTEAATTLNIGGTAYLQIPSVIPGVHELNAVEVGLTGTLNITTLSFNVGFTLSGACGVATCTWMNAFGISGLDVDELAGSIGVDFETTPIPLPTFSLNVDKLVLPDGWATAIGMTQGASVSLALVVNVTAPLLDISITPPDGSTVALRPLAVVTSDPSLADELQIGAARLFFAPVGGLEADGTTVDPGIDLTFSAQIAGVSADVQAAVSLDPTNPSITADVQVGSFSVGPIAFGNPMLHLAISAQSADFSFSGSVVDYTTGVYFGASADLGASVSELHAMLSLTVTGGLPSFLYATGSLVGRIDLDPASGQFEVTASGAFRLVIGGQVISWVSVSWSSNSSVIWNDLNNDAAAIAAAIASAGYNIQYAIQVLKSVGFNWDQIAQALSSGFGAATSTIITAFTQFGLDVNSAIQTAINDLHAGANDIAAALQQLGWSPGSIAGELQNWYSSSSATVYNALVSIGDSGQSFIDMLSSLFNNGSHVLYVGDAPDVLDVSGASNDSGTGLIQWPYHGGTNQDWYVLPTDSGFAELVNRNSGQCASVPYYTTGAVNLDQEPCTGSLLQQWYFGDPTNVDWHTFSLWNRWSGLYMDVTGGGWGLGTPVEQYPYNGGGNQQWRFSPGA